MRLSLAAIALAGCPATAGLASPVPVGLPIGFGPGSKPDIAYDVAGNFVVVWNGYGPTEWCSSCRSAFGRQHDRFGARLSESFLVNQSPGYVENVWAPRVGVASNGHFIVTWTSDTEYQSEKPYARAYAADATPIGGEFVASEGVEAQGFGDAVALASGNFALVWHYNSGFHAQPRSDVVMRVFDPDGTPLGDPFTVDQPGGRHGSPQVDAATDGDVVVSWWAAERINEELTYHIMARRFDVTAAPSGAEFAVSSFGVNSYPSLGVGDDDSFLVAWVNRDEDRSRVVGRQHDAANSPLGPEFVVATDTARSTNVPAVARLSNGGFIVVWETYDSDDANSPSALSARTFNASGAPDGPEFPIETWGDAGYPAVAGDPFGGFTVVWAGRELTAQRFTRAPHCADADGDAATTATDALVILNGAVGNAACANCVCDADSSGVTTARDALRVLHAATGQEQPNCPPCG